MKHHYISATIRYLLAAAFAACWLGTALASEQSDMIAKLQQSGQLRLDCNAGKAWLDPNLWQAVDADAKGNFARTIFESCHSVPALKSITIYDAQSSKKLATYSKEAGLKVD
ncbi:MAG TPA: hypothetical protein VGI60_18745 [Chthoniobacterales bacterium]|jgi:hypothetical protein